MSIDVKKHNSYKHGLLKGDLVTCSVDLCKVYLYSKHTFLILNKHFLFEKETRFGKRSFWKYQAIDISNNNIVIFRTQDIRVHKTKR